jgi:hypothetical protein
VFKGTIWPAEGEIIRDVGPVQTQMTNSVSGCEVVLDVPAPLTQDGELWAETCVKARGTYDDINLMVLVIGRHEFR